jgi:hypothetical protein
LVYTGSLSVGNACNLAELPRRHRHGRRMTGITRTVPALWHSSFHFGSTSRMSSEDRKSELRSSSRMM